MSHGIARIAVLGAGTMGHGIAQIAAAAGFATRLFDVDEAALERGRAKIRDNLDKGVAKGKVSVETRDRTLAGLSGSTRLEDAVGDADLVIEAVPERLDLKRELVVRSFAAAPPHMAFATNTSSLSVTEIAAAAPRPDAVVGMHFFNPPHIVKLLEIVRAETTSPATLETARQVGIALERELIVVQDSPGFASSRLGLVLGLEAMRMLEQGVASAEDIDRAMELGYKHPMGPLRLTDLVGLDVRLAIAEYLHRELGSDAFHPPQILRRLVRAGKLGKKSGEGFYRYPAGA